MKFCPNCGRQLTEGVKFCPNCGYSLIESEQVESAAPQINHNEHTTASGSETDGTRNERNIASKRSNQQQKQTAQQGQPQLGFIDSTKYVFQHVFDFSGMPPESRRSVFWWGFLSVTIVEFVLIFIPIIGWFLAIAAQGLLVSAVMRRLNYLNMNPKIAWLMFVPLIGYYPWGLMFLSRKVEVH